MDAREIMALELLADARISYSGGAWSVPSQTTSARYRVDTTGEKATCTGFAQEQRKERPLGGRPSVRVVPSRATGARRVQPASGGCPGGCGEWHCHMP